MTTTTMQFEIPGANPFTLEGPIVTGTGQVGPQFRPGNALAQGDAGAEFVYCSLTLGSTTSLTDGMVMGYDKDYAASLLTTSNAVRGNDVGVCRVTQANVPAGTYYIWLQRAGHVKVQSNASAPAAQLCETTATAGQINAASTPTVGSKRVQGLFLQVANGGSAGVTDANVMWPYIDVTN